VIIKKYTKSKNRNYQNSDIFEAEFQNNHDFKTYEYKYEKKYIFDNKSETFDCILSISSSTPKNINKERERDKRSWCLRIVKEPKAKVVMQDGD